MRFETGENTGAIECFTPREGVTLDGTFKPSETNVYKLGADVVITLDSISVAYKAGDEICLSEYVTYTFATSTPAHKM